MPALPFIDKFLLFDAEDEIKRKRGLILFSVIICIMAAAYIFIGLKGEAVRDYFYYGDALLNGIRPYEPYNDLNWEYPPLAYLFLLVPRLFASDPYDYQVAYVIMMTLFTLVGLWVVRKMSLDHGKNAKMMMTLYTVSVALMVQFFFDRFDGIVALFTMVAIYLYLKKRYSIAFILIVVGMLIKLYPGLLFPIFLIPFIASRDIRNTLINVGVFIGSALILIAPFFLLSPDTFFTFIEYHSDRGLQIESIAASFIMFLELFGFTSTQTNHEFWAFNIEGGLADAIVPFMMPLMIVAIVIFYLAYFVNCIKEKDGNERSVSVIWASFTVLLIFMTFNKVFSAQYMIWIMMILIPMLIYSKEKEWGRPVIYMFITSLVLTLYFGLLYTGLHYHWTIPVLLLIIRNLLIIYMLVWILRHSGIIKGTSETIKNNFRNLKCRSGD